MIPAIRLIELPLHNGPFVETPGAKGSILTIAFTDAGILVQPFALTVTLYVPACIDPAFAIVGF